MSSWSQQQHGHNTFSGTTERVDYDAMFNGDWGFATKYFKMSPHGCLPCHPHISDLSIDSPGSTFNSVASTAFQGGDYCDFLAKESHITVEADTGRAGIKGT